jgi:uncharacterized protein (DUF952 family)/predicted N-acetyltransferase YhbS
MNDRPRIFHITDTALLRRSEAPGGDGFLRPESLETEGFIHCSFRDQVGRTLERYFVDPSGDLPAGLVVAEIDPFLTEAVIRAEPGTGGETDDTGTPILFPHLFGPLPVAAISAVHDAARFLRYHWRFGGYEITDDPSAVSVDVATAFLADESYWAQGRSRETVVRSLEHAWVLSAVAPDGTMAGMARVITDWATMYYLSDLFVLQAHRGKGVGKELVRGIVEYPPLRGLKGILRTADAFSLYERFGFERDGTDSRCMRRPGAESRN